MDKWWIMVSKDIIWYIVSLRRHMRPHQLWDLQTSTATKLRSGAQNSQSLAKVSVASDGRFTLPWRLHDLRILRYYHHRWHKMGWLIQPVRADTCRLCILQFVDIISLVTLHRHRRSYGTGSLLSAWDPEDPTNSSLYSVAGEKRSGVSWVYVKWCEGILKCQRCVKIAETWRVHHPEQGTIWWSSQLILSWNCPGWPGS